MITKPASPFVEGNTMSPESGAIPRGSCRIRRRSQSPSRSRWRILSSIVSPGTSSTPPTTIRLGSPSAWASTQWMTLPRRTRGPYALARRDRHVFAFEPIAQRSGTGCAICLFPIPDLSLGLHAMTRRAAWSRLAALLCAGALAVHELRYLLAFGAGSGRALAHDGHAYLGAINPLVAVLVAGVLAQLMRLGARGGAQAGARPAATFGRWWIEVSAALVFI